jgi:hypothetical protein
MSIKETVHYNRCDDQIYGLGTWKSNVVGKKPHVANKMLCFVIHGLSTKFLIPVGYFFHASLATNDFFSLTMNILQMVTDCGFIVLRLVTDNIQGAPELAAHRKQACADNKRDSKLTKINFLLAQITEL